MRLTYTSTSINEALAKVIATVKAPRKAILAALKAYDQRVRTTFRTETDPWGIAWEPLKQTTLDARSNDSTAILVDSAKMFRSLDTGMTSDTEGFITVGTDDRFPEVHQFGNPNNTAWGGALAPIPARPMFPIRAATREVDLPDPWVKDLMDPLDAEIKKAISNE